MHLSGKYLKRIQKPHPHIFYSKNIDFDQKKYFHKNEKIKENDVKFQKEWKNYKAKNADGILESRE